MVFILKIATGCLLALAWGRDTTLVDSRHPEVHWYYQGWDALQNRKWDEAVTYFSRFLKENPDHVYADRALDHVGDAYLGSGEYSSVLMTGRKLEDNFPYSMKRSENMVRRAISYQKLGREDLAKDELLSFRQRFPEMGLIPLPTGRG